MKWTSTMLLAISIIQTAHGAVLTFDDLPRGTKVGDQYASLGVHFDLSDFGVQEGLANGDSGIWLLDGTSGPFFDGFNGGESSTYSMTLTFDAPVSSFSLDASRSNGSLSGDTLTVSGFLGATLIETRTVTFGEINNWTTVSLPGVFDRVMWSGQGLGYHPYGVDNINFTSVPEPSMYALAPIGGFGLLAVVRSRRRRTWE